MLALVTGAAGFIGSHLCHALVCAGYDVIPIDDLSMYGVNSIDFLKLRQHSILDYAAMETAMREISCSGVVFHLACVNIENSATTPANGWLVNACGTHSVAQLANKYGVRRFIYTASSSAYGDGDIPSVESQALHPGGEYARSKHIGELACLKEQTNGLRLTVVRLSNTYGESPICQSSVMKFVRAARENKELLIYGNGEDTRDYIHISDVINGLMLAATEPMAEGEIINLGTGIETSSNQLAALVSDACGGVDIAYTRARDGVDVVRRRCLNIDKAHNLLDWKPMVNLQDEIYRMCL